MSILVATDLSNAARPAVRVAARMAVGSDRRLDLLHVVDFSGDDNAWRVLYEDPEAIEEHARQEALEALRTLYESVVPEEARGEIDYHVAFGRPFDGIEKVIETLAPQMVVVGTRGQSRLQELFFGRTTNRLVRSADIPVLAVPPNFEGATLRKVLAPVDFSECSRASLERAAGLCRVHGATLDVMNAFALPGESTVVGTAFANLHTRADDLLASRREQLREFAQEVGVEDVLGEYVVYPSRPADAIRGVARDGAHDMICMGTHGRRGFARWFLGSTAEAVLRKAPCPVMVIRHPE